MKVRRHHPVVIAAYRWVTVFVDPRRMARAFNGIIWYIKDFLRYRRMPGAEALRIVDSFPVIHEKALNHELDAHYFYVNGWAIRRMCAAKPQLHVDLASLAVLSSLASAFIPTVFVDYRAFRGRLTGMSSLSADILNLPFKDRSLDSISCLHAAEHIGLGRYGDPLDPRGTARAAAEISRVLAQGGNLFFGIPIGRERVCFNAHRVHRASSVRELFPELELLEFSGVTDDGTYCEHLALDALDNEEYGCGFFWFRRS